MAARRRLGAMARDVEAIFRCPACHGKRIITKAPREKGDATAPAADFQPKLCEVCHGDGVNSSEAVLAALREYCKALDECRSRWPDEPEFQRPRLAQSILKRVRWTPTAERFNQVWSKQATEGKTGKHGAGYILTVDTQSARRSRSGGVILIEARAASAKSGGEGELVQLRLRADRSSEIVRLLDRGQPAKLMVLAYDDQPSSEMKEAAGEGGWAAEPDAQPESEIERGRVLTVLDARLIRSGALRSVVAPAPKPKRSSGGSGSGFRIRCGFH